LAEVFPSALHKLLVELISLTDIVFMEDALCRNVLTFCRNAGSTRSCGFAAVCLHTSMPSLMRHFRTCCVMPWASAALSAANLAQVCTVHGVSLSVI